MESLTKQKNKFNLYDVCFIISALAGAGILIAMPYKETTIMSLGTYTIAICAVLMYVKRFSNYLHHMSHQDLAVLLLVFVCLTAVGFSHSDIKTNFINLLCFLEIPIFMLCAKNFNSKRTLEFFLWVQYILSFYYLYLSQTDKAYLFEGKYDIMQLEELTLSYNNPNEAAMYLTACFVALLIAVVTYKKIILKLMFLINATIVAYLVWLTGARVGVVVCALVAMCLVFIKKIKIKKAITRIILLIPMIMIILIYSYNDQLVNLQLLGSSVETGRINVFEYVFSDLDFREIFFGDFATHSFANFHNIYVTIFGTIGIFGVTIYAFFLDHSLISQQKNVDYSLAQKMAYIGVLSFVIYSSVEATLFTGGSAFAMCFIGVFVSFAFQSQKTEEFVEP